MKDGSDKNPPSEKGEFGLDRRLFFRISAGTLAAALLLNVERRRRSATPHINGKISILPSCTGCTGCAPVCPTNAIRVMPGGISISDEDCVSCGYCISACPVSGLRINREGG